MAQKAHNLSHTKWMCKYHIVFTLSIDEKSFIINIEVVWGEIFHRLCSYKGVDYRRTLNA